MNADIKDLLKQAQGLRLQDVLPILLLVVLLGSLPFTVRAYLSERTERRELEAELESTRNAIVRIREMQELGPEGMKQRIAEAKDDLAEKLDAFPTSDEAQAELNNYYDYASALNSELRRSEVVVVDPNESDPTVYKVQRYFLEVWGEVPDLIRFLDRVANGPYPTFLVDNVVVRAGDPPIGNANLVIYSSDLSQEIDTTSEPGALVTPMPTLILPTEPAPTPTAQGGAEPTATLSRGTIVYVVRAGDSLSSLARRQRTTPEEIMAMNGLDTANIYVGQELILPAR